MAVLQYPLYKSLPEIKELYIKGGWMRVAAHYNITVPDIVSLLSIKGYLTEVKLAKYKADQEKKNAEKDNESKRLSKKLC